MPGWPFNFFLFTSILLDFLKILFSLDDSIVVFSAMLVLFTRQLSSTPNNKYIKKETAWYVLFYFIAMDHFFCLSFKSLAVVLVLLPTKGIDWGADSWEQC